MIKWIVFSGLVACAIANAGEDPRPDMHVMADEIASLQKYMASDADFSAPANAESIRKSLEVLNHHLAHLTESSFSDAPELRVNATLLTQQFADANRAFIEGSKSYARYMVQSSLQMCIACHTRTKTADFPITSPDISKLGPTEQGDFLFATRQFAKANEQFTSMVEGFPANKIGYTGLRKALLSQAIYYSRVKDDPTGGAAYFTRLAQRNDFPDYAKREVGAWARDFGAWSKEKPGKTASLTDTQLLDQAKRILRKDDFSLIEDADRSFHIRRLRATVLLHRVLESPGDRSPMKADALYYLGQIYHRISSNLFFHFGEMYFKTCIQQYQKTAMAKRCYGALEEAVTEGYTGSGGTDIPDDEQVEMIRLRRLAY